MGRMISDIDIQLKKVCRIGQGEECCRYITCGSNGIECAKNTGLQYIIDKNVAEGSMTAKGDNCPGINAEEE